MVPLAIFPRMLDFLNTWEIFEHFIHSMQCLYSTGTSAIVYILEWKDKGTNADSDPVAIVTCFSPRCNLPCFVFLIASIFKKKKKSGANQSFPSLKMAQNIYPKILLLSVSSFSPRRPLGNCFGLRGPEQTAVLLPCSVSFLIEGLFEGDSGPCWKRRLSFSADQPLLQRMAVLGTAEISQ